MRKILLVDDDEDDRNLFIEAVQLTDVTIQVDTVSNGIEAFQYLERCLLTGKLPEAIFLDINMPKMNGIQVLKKLQTLDHYGAIKVIILSTANGRHEGELARVFGADIIEKAANFRDLVKNISDSIRSI